MKNIYGIEDSFAPLRHRVATFPTAYAVGYILFAASRLGPMELP
jgi:hypothetical protein